MDEIRYKNKIVRNRDLREKEYKQADIRFCSVLNSNLAYTKILEKGNLAGNGWISCNFYGAVFKNLTMVMEQYDRCSLGNVELDRTECRRLRARDCSFAGGSWTEVLIQESTFRNCDFRGVEMKDIRLDRTVFCGCIFSSVIPEHIQMEGVIFQNCRFCGQINGLSWGYTFENCCFDC